jgi:hypothetical protein
MNRNFSACSAKVCQAVLSVATGIILLGHAQANTTVASESSTAKVSAAPLPIGRVDASPGALSISADGRTAVHIGINGDVALWDAVKVKLSEIIRADGQKPSVVALSSNGDLVAIGYADSRIIVRSRSEHKLLHEFKGHFGTVLALAFSPNGQLLASGGDDATTQLWELSTGRRTRVFDSQFGETESGGSVVSLAFSGNGRALIVNEWFSRHYEAWRGTTLWDIEEGIELSTRDVAPPNSDEVMRAGQALGGKSWCFYNHWKRWLLIWSNKFWWLKLSGNIL